MHKLIEYIDNYSETSASLWQYYRDELAVNDDGNIIDFLGNNASFKFLKKQRVKQVTMTQKPLK